MAAKDKNKNGKPELKSVRDGFGEGLLALGKNKDVVALTADLGESVRMDEFAQKYPDRFIQVGIAEQNMAGIAAGLGLSGKIPFTGTFACFQPMRNLDQIRTSICIMNSNVKLVSSHAGFTHAADGVQIQALEDIAIMRALPNMTVLVPADATQAAELTKQSVEIYGPVYIRLGRSKTPIIETDQELEIGKAQILRPGTDGTIIACGYMVQTALDAANELEKSGLHVSVLNIHTIKPLDANAILEATKQSHKILTLEEHQQNGGLGSAVAEVLAQSDLEYKMRIMGVDDRFGETASKPEELYNSRGLSVQDVVKNLKEFL